MDDPTLTTLLERDAELRSRLCVLKTHEIVREMKETRLLLKEVNVELAEKIPSEGITFLGKHYTVNATNVAPLKRKALDEYGVDLRQYDAACAVPVKRVKRGKAKASKGLDEN